MEAIIFLSIIITLFSIFVSCLVIRRVKKQIAEITDALADVKNGNGNRRILSATNELVAPLAYEINEIVVSYEKRLSTVRQAEETNRQLMTSLSHDVRTPLTTLIGYLDAAHRGIVTGKDKDDYIETARRKAHDLKEYIDILFDWFKLNSNEFAMEKYLDEKHGRVKETEYTTETVIGSGQKPSAVAADRRAEQEPVSVNRSQPQKAEPASRAKGEVKKSVLQSLKDFQARAKAQEQNKTAEKSKTHKKGEVEL